MTVKYYKLSQGQMPVSPSTNEYFSEHRPFHILCKRTIGSSSDMTGMNIRLHPQLWSTSLLLFTGGKAQMNLSLILVCLLLMSSEC